MRSWKAAGITLAAVLVGGCAAAAPSTPPSAPSPEASPSASAAASVDASATPRPSPLPHFAEMVDVGGGQEVFVECTGEGSPTIVFESGDADDGRAWVKVVPALVKSNRVCTYDRLGTGRSDPATGCRGADDLRGVLEAWLKAKAVDPPYVLVGTSGGGYLVAGYALAHPEDVQGLVIVETFPAIDLSKYPPELAFEIGCDNAENLERRDYAAVEHAAWDKRTKIGDVPLVVITNDYTGYAENVDEENSVEGQRGWFELSPDQAKQVVVKSGHDVPGMEPAVVIDAIRDVLDGAAAS
jgi:pimeloyl-ACP methyl ester carboxylesterase